MELDFNNVNKKFVFSDCSFVYLFIEFDFHRKKYQHKQKIDFEIHTVCQLVLQ